MFLVCSLVYRFCPFLFGGGWKEQEFFADIWRMPSKGTREFLLSYRSVLWLKVVEQSSVPPAPKTNLFYRRRLSPDSTRGTPKQRVFGVCTQNGGWGVNPWLSRVDRNFPFEDKLNFGWGSKSETEAFRLDSTGWSRLGEYISPFNSGYLL